MSYSGNSRRMNIAVVVVLLVWLSPTVDSAEQPKSCSWSDPSYETGFFTSPNFPSHYGNDEECSLVLTAPRGTAIRFEANPLFSTEMCGECKCDYLMFSEVNPLTNIQMVRSWCGSDQPEPYVTQTSQVKLEFHSDKYQTFRGFNVTWRHVEKTCGDTVKGTSGIIDYSPEFFKGFNSCKWDISVMPGQRVSVNLNSLFHQAITERGDTLEVVGYPIEQVETNRGIWELGDEPPSSEFKSFGSRISIVIHKNNTVGMETGDALWKAVDECGGVFTEPHGIILLPEFRSNCTWDIEAPREHHIALQVEGIPSRFNAGYLCNNTTLRVLDYLEVNNTYVGPDSICDINTYPRFNSTGSKIRIVYTDILNIPPFPISWITACGRTLYDSQGTVSFPGDSVREYPSNKDCEWIIHGAPEHVIRLDFNTAFDLDTFSNVTCDYDYVEVVDFAMDEAKSLGKFCGNKAPSRITSSSNKLHVRFHSDGTKQGSGFQFSWDSTCGEAYNGTEGSFNSPKRPINYPANLDCRWEIQVPDGHSVQLEVSEPYSIEASEDCDSDYLEIFDSSTTGELTSKGRWCGQQRPPLLTSVTSRMVAVFHSDSSKSGVGFNAQWKAVNVATYDCGQVFTSPEGSFSSPGYPQPYPANRKCRWEINAPEGQRLKLSFDVLDLEMNNNDCSYDGVEVLGTLPNGKLMSYGRWCSVSDIPDIYSMSKLVVLFYSDATKNGQGFSASFTSDSECGGTIIGKAGHLVTPNFPSNYPEDIECRWNILVPDASQYEIRFDPRFDLEFEEDCSYDNLVVSFNGTRGNTFCGTDGPSQRSPLILPSHNVTLVFKSDKSITGKGFMATLSSYTP